MQDSLIDFIGIGAPRCGTTWLAECLRQHPDVLLPLRKSGLDAELKYQDLTDAKEVNFFIDVELTDTYYVPHGKWYKGVDWYLHRFPLAQPGKIRGEISPDYLRVPHSSELIKATFPKAKLIVSLRNPIDMVYSLYWLQKYGRATEGFEELLHRGLYLNVGLYAQQLARYLERFPREQIHVILFEDISERPEQVVRDLYAFLGVRSDFQPSVLNKKINMAGNVRSQLLKSAMVKVKEFIRGHGLSFIERHVVRYDKAYDWYLRLNIGKRPYEKMLSETRTRLQAYYRNDIELLEKLIGRDLSAWKAS